MWEVISFPDKQNNWFETGVLVFSLTVFIPELS